MGCVHALAEGDGQRFQYVVTEVLNNVIDHSKSVTYRIVLKRAGDKLRLVIEDGGIGIFENLKSYFKLSDTWEAIGDLAKGRRTTVPSRHAGEGLFFSARMADVFSSDANRLLSGIIGNSRASNNAYFRFFDRICPTSHQNQK
ncbi:MAG: ATP-binding protein [Oligoflexus sp.]|nr:ATP-binding protein [Oligoflexus sp.]